MYDTANMDYEGQHKALFLEMEMTNLMYERDLNMGNKAEPTDITKILADPKYDELNKKGFDYNIVGLLERKLVRVLCPLLCL